jgi:hypothetical protein
MLRRLTLLVALPATLAHELLHAAAALPWAKRVQVDIRPRAGAAHARVRWADEVSQPVVAFSALAPAIAGVLALWAAVWSGVFGALPPGSTADFALLAVVGGYAALTFGVSRQDIAEARGETHE